MMCSSECIVVFVQPLHDDFPIGIDSIKLCRLTRQLFPDVFTKEDVLCTRNTKIQLEFHRAPIRESDSSGNDRLSVEKTKSTPGYICFNEQLLAFSAQGDQIMY